MDDLSMTFSFNRAGDGPRVSEVTRGPLGTRFNDWGRK
jgi:hypothetical protein